MLPQISTIYVGGISFDTDERALQNYFSKFGTVTEVKVRRLDIPLTASRGHVGQPPPEAVDVLPHLTAAADNFTV